jgi:hypothetical protein
MSATVINLDMAIERRMAAQDREFERMARQLGYASGGELLDDYLAAWEAAEELKARKLGYASLDEYLETMRLEGEQ